MIQLNLKNSLLYSYDTVNLMCILYKNLQVMQHCYTEIKIESII